jgi:hypothetical protein
MAEFEPTSDQAVPVVPPPVVAVKRRFSWRDFFIGMARWDDLATVTFIRSLASGK